MNTKRFRNYLRLVIIWKKKQSGDYSSVGPQGEKLDLLIREFPEEDLYHLYQDNKFIGSFNDWPPQWYRPAKH